jgi:hypothetical protein
VNCCLRIKGVLYARAADNCCAQYCRILDNAEISLSITYEQYQQSKRKSSYFCRSSVVKEARLDAKTDGLTAQNLAFSIGSANLRQPQKIKGSYSATCDGKIVVGASSFYGEVFRGPTPLIEGVHYKRSLTGITLIDDFSSVDLDGSTGEMVCLTADYKDQSLLFDGLDCVSCKPVVIEVKRSIVTPPQSVSLLDSQQKLTFSFSVQNPSTGLTIQVGQ